LGLPWAASLIERYPDYIHSFIHFPGYPGLPEQSCDPREFARFLTNIQDEEFDLVLQMQGNGSIVNPLIDLFGARYTAGFHLPGDYGTNNPFFMAYPGDIHEIERHLKLMNHLGIESKGTHLEFPIYKKDIEDYNSSGLLLKPEKYVCIHPGSRGAWRQWPPEFFAALGNYCEEEGLSVVLTGTNEEMPVIEEVCRHLNKLPVIAAGRTSLGAVAILIKNARLLISNCTGVSHIAAALKTPSVVISMDKEPGRWAPLDTQLHPTLDWSRDQNFDSVVRALKDLLFKLDRNHLGNRISNTVK
jgi:ADP-heptose:LPS heptosyltransferase